MVHKPPHRWLLNPHEKYVHIGDIVLYARKDPLFKNSMTLRVRYSFENSHNKSETAEVTKHFTYSEIYGAIDIGSNKRWDVTRINPLELSEKERR